MDVSRWDRERWRRMARGFLKMKNASEDCCRPLFEEAEDLLLSRIRPAYVFRVFPLAFSSEGVALSGSTLVLPGASIRRHLEGCLQGILLCATLGAGAESALRVARAREMALAAVTDAVASAMTELLCDDAQEEILFSLGVENATSRFSPGYGDLGLEVQGEFLRCVDAHRRLGVSLSEGGLLLPRKTVTAVIGVK